MLLAVACGLAGAWPAPDASALAIQPSAASVRPSLARVDDDRGRAFADGCEASRAATSSPPCVYGAGRSRTTVVLLGDSHAMHFFAAMSRVAERRHWRLVVLTKSGCPAADIVSIRRDTQRIYHECTDWRRAMLRRIAHREHPRLVVTSMSNATVVVGDDGSQTLKGADRLRALGRGYATTVKALAARGPRVVAIHDVPRPPFDVPACVAQWMHDLRRCAFAESDGRTPIDPTDALHGLPRVTVIDPVGRLCVGGLCPGVIDDDIVYRKDGHLTATFAGTLTGWLDRRLPALK
jgi:antitoxin (DNA-binding transcriptional repressor) of toxin-antitoxin stability system